VREFLYAWAETNKKTTIKINDNNQPMGPMQLQTFLMQTFLMRTYQHGKQIKKKQQQSTSNAGPMPCQCYANAMQCHLGRREGLCERKMQRNATWAEGKDYVREFFDAHWQGEQIKNKQQ